MQAPPQQFLPVVEKTKATYKNWIPIHRNMPRAERFGMGLRIDLLFLDLLELLRRATYAQPSQKLEILMEALGKTDSLRFFLQISWEVKLIPNEQFISIGKEIEAIGKMLGGWRKGLLAKTPPASAGGERR